MQILLMQVVPSLVISAFLAVGFSAVKARLLAWSSKVSRG